MGLSGSAFGAPNWHPVDKDEVQRLRVERPQAAELFERADEKLKVGDFRGADRLLAEARTVDPQSWLLGRRHCQVLTELGRQSEALEACQVAMVRSTAMDSRALVGALMATPTLASPRGLIQAVREAVAARRLQEQPFSDAALCDIAHHIGDDAMLNSCVERLQAVAPDHFETLRWQSVRRQSPAWALWLGWLGIALAVLLTGLHATWRWLRRPAKRTAAVAAAMLALAAPTGVARAEDQAASPVPAADANGAKKWQLSQFSINHADPESSVIPSIDQRNKAPLEFGYFLQDLNTEALKAERQGDYRTAVKYWRTAAKAVPEAAVGFGKACRAHQILGEREQALEYCSKALNREGATQEDYLRFGELATQKPLALTQLEIQDLDAVVTHLKAQPGVAGPTAVVECRLGVKLDDPVRLARCTKVLGTLSPNDPRTMTFLWSYAMLRKDYREAKRLVAAMEKTSMARPALAQVREATAKASAWWRLLFTDWRYGLGLLGAVGLVAGGLVLLRRRVSRLDTSGGTGPAPAT